MAKLNRTDFDEIRVLASQMGQNIAATWPPIRLASAPTVTGVAVVADIEAASDFQLRDVRAAYLPNSRSIALIKVPWQPQFYANPTSSADEIARWFTHVLAHEACHARQHQLDASLFPDGDGKRASELNKAYAKSGSAEDYVAYVTHRLEIEAHATQLAAEILLIADDLDLTAFDGAAQESDLIAHVREHAEGHADALALEARLIREAYACYERMRA